MLDPDYLGWLRNNLVTESRLDDAWQLLQEFKEYTKQLVKLEQELCWRALRNPPEDRYRCEALLNSIRHAIEAEDHTNLVPWVLGMLPYVPEASHHGTALVLRGLAEKKAYGGRITLEPRHGVRLRPRGTRGSGAGSRAGRGGSRVGERQGACQRAARPRHRAPLHPGNRARILEFEWTAADRVDARAGAEPQSATTPVVFLSSATREAEYREVVRSAVASAGLELLSLETRLRDGSPMQASRHAIAKADLVILVVGNGYGRVPPESAGRRDEELYVARVQSALDAGKPVLVFLEFEETQRRRLQLDDSQEQRSGLRAFKSALMERQVVTTSKTPTTLPAT